MNDINKNNLTESKTKLPDNIIPVSKEIKKIPVLSKISFNTDILSEENIETYMSLPASLLPENTDDLFFLKYEGIAMNPTIRYNALVLVKIQSDVKNDDVVAVLINGELTFKRVKKLSGYLLLTSDNSNTSPIILNSHKDIKIIGKAIQTFNAL